DSVKEAQSAQEARRLAAEGFEQSIYDNAFSGLTSGLGDMIMSGVVTPMMNSLLAGATASSTALATGGTVAAGSMAAGGAAGGGAVAAGGAAAGGAVAAGGSAAASLMSSFMDSARAYIGSFTQILSDPEVRQGIKDISALVGDVAGTLYQSGGAFSGGGSSPTLNTGSGQQAASEADNLNDALKRLGETMGDEVKRLRGLMVDDSSQSQAVLLARFATSTAAARAGDLKAAELLPELSKAIEAATKASAFSAVELARMRGWLAGSLEETAQLAGIKLPAFAVGTNYVPRDMLALIHEGEAIVPKAYNPAAQGADSGAPVQALHMSFERFAGAQLESSLNAQRILLRAVRVLERWESGGMPAQRAENWSPA
ncbi:MAG: hypothetical protein JSR53_16250, partial [Proteobacteria bacterium]|nr:hypothetical protein [Pseudomonadota bacterium]